MRRESDHQSGPDHPEPAHPAGGTARAGRRTARWELYAFLEIFALSGLAVAQPLLDAIGRSPDFLLFHRAGPAEALALAVLVALLPPAVLWAVGLPARLAGPRVRRLVHAGLLGGLVAVFAVQVGKHLLPLRGVPLAILAVLTGVAVAVSYPRITAIGQIMRVAAAGPIVFVTLFVFASPASAVMLGGRSTGATAAAAGREVGAHPPVVVLVLDEFPLVSLLDSAGRVDAERVPNFARLAAGSNWYRNATGVSPLTTYAVPSMLTGKYPSGERAPHYSRYPENLFTLVGEVYQVQAWETVTQLCPPDTCVGGSDRGGLPSMVRESASLLGRMTSPYDSTEDPTAGFQEATVTDGATDGATDRDLSPEAGSDFRMGRLGENQPARFRDFLTSLPAPPVGSPPVGSPPVGSPPVGSPSAGSPSASASGERPVLRFLHLLVPHSPWLYLSSGTRYDGPGDLPYDGQWWARLAYQRHLQQVEYADRLLGEALDALTAAGLYDESLIVVTSDHGDSFSEGVSGRDMDRDQRAAAELAWVPLFIKEPGQRAGRIDDRNWQQVDLLPTIADYAGIEVPWAVDGRSALRDRRAGADKRFDHVPGTPITIDGNKHFPAVLRGPAARPVLPDVPAQELVGHPVTDYPVTGAGPTVEVANGAEFADVKPDRGKIPALVDATLTEGAGRPAVGTPVAIAVNGRIGAVALAARDHDGDLRVVGLVTDERLFVAGSNRLELYTVSGAAGGWRLTPCRIG